MMKKQPFFMSLVLMCGIFCGFLITYTSVLAENTDTMKNNVSKNTAPWNVVQREEIAKVWSGNPVGFDFLVHEGYLFIAFYDATDQKMVIGQKKMPASGPSSAHENWVFKKMPTAIGWDSHNYIKMIFDSENYLHVSGNMHCVPLIYYRAEKPLDVESLTVVNRMIATDTTPEALNAARENRCTYPHFMKNADGELIFTYRDGSSGNGVQLWNLYDTKTRTWRRLLDTPMFDGEGECNAYYHGPKLGPDGYYHVAWVWRDTPDCATNHDLSYMRSRDLIHWEKSDGSPQMIPATRSNSEVIAPLKNGEGLLNPLVAIGFDTDGHVILTYTRYDENQNNQLMQARRESNGWKYYQTSEWTHSWIFSGGGCIPTELSFSPVEVVNGKIEQFWNRKYEKSGRFILDSTTLKPVGPAPATSSVPAECYRNENPQENQTPRRSSITDPRNPNRLYFFAWETFPINRDRPYKVKPEPSTLRMFILER
ncbi:MAG: BNR repeat-containing protein [Planctomycetia bacterium]|nr:BNR repeat-containing protein [Planctomycetia bacterium]